MIAIDTNVLLRYLLNDDKVQSPQVTKLIESHEHVLITDVVLTETIWTLKGKKHKASKEDIIKVINDLLSEPTIDFENPQVIWQALSDYRKAEPVKVSGKNKTADFSDALIVNKAKWLAQSLDLTLEAVYTFDIAAQALSDAIGLQ